MMEAGPAEHLIWRIAHIAGARPVRWRKVAAGHTLAQRWLVELEGGRRAFTKIASNRRTAEWLRAEHRIYSTLKAPWLPSVIAWHDDGRQPILLLEDLSGETWPPPWTTALVQQVLATLSQVRQAAPPIPLMRLAIQRESLMCWRQIAQHPQAFLALNLCTAEWLEAALPRLMAAEASAQLDGDDLVHGDLKSGNICFQGTRCILIDWNWACRGSGLVDVADWLLDVDHEGALMPKAPCPGLGDLAALLTGYNADCATRPEPPQAPGIRQLQLAKARLGLPWVCQELGIPQPTPAVTAG